eukprot:GEZU01042828.1.p1 GENE.GEZU01042828.1~~GEZU01042828.1.p1  ORF type:complete len:124 (+),score=27.20 GEZU01042828.1:143-514(+)
MVLRARTILAEDVQTPASDELVLNRNTEWTKRISFRVFYVFLIFMFEIFVSFLGFDRQTSWTITNFVHCGFTFIFFHWLKGSPLNTIIDDQGKFDKLTFWEQLDNQKQFTPTRKFLIVVPVIL